MVYDLIIIGAGASGMAAAITAKNSGSNVAVLESMDRVGKKILITGNGRCNITNESVSEKNYYSSNEGFYIPVLKEVSLDDVRDFFASLGLPLTTLENGKMFPLSLQASSVLDILRFAVEDREIPLYLNEKVKRISHKNNEFIIKTQNGSEYFSRKVILAAGGMSASKTGSDGSGYELSKVLGHKIIKPIPALVQLKLDYKNLKALSGIKFEGTAYLYSGRDFLLEKSGEILFTDYGISGPPILELSRTASKHLSLSKNINLKIDLMPNFNKQELKSFLENHFALLQNRSVAESFIGVINKKLIPTLLKDSSVDSLNKPCMNLSFYEKMNILNNLKEWTFKVSGTNSFNESQVTAGGVDTSDVNPETLESKLVDGLYFAGEILDVDGDCGGFNLHWAWASGITAGKNGAK